MSASETSTPPMEEHPGHPAQKAQGAGCCGGHEHDPSEATTAGDGHDTKEQADRPAQKAEGVCGCG
jgi:hypothetical protein